MDKGPFSTKAPKSEEHPGPPKKHKMHDLEDGSKWSFHPTSGELSNKKITSPSFRLRFDFGYLTNKRK
jgi:hypothetical protein